MRLGRLLNVIYIINPYKISITKKKVYINNHNILIAKKQPIRGYTN